MAPFGLSNSVIYAMQKLQEQMKGEAEKAGFSFSADVAAWIAEKPLAMQAQKYNLLSPPLLGYALASPGTFRYTALKEHTHRKEVKVCKEQRNPRLI